MLHITNSPIHDPWASCSMKFPPQTTKLVRPYTVTGKHNVILFSKMLTRLGPCMVVSLVKGQREAYRRAWRGFWRRGHWWRTVSGLIKRIMFLSEDPGGWLLPATMRQGPNPVKTRPNRWTGQSPGNWLPSFKLKLICSSSAQITSFYQGCLLWFHYFILAHIYLFVPSFIFRITHLHPDPSVSFCLLSYVFL